MAFCENLSDNNATILSSQVYNNIKYSIYMYGSVI